MVDEDGIGVATPFRRQVTIPAELERLAELRARSCGGVDELRGAGRLRR